MDPNTIRINNTIYSWLSTRFLIGPLPYVGIRAVDYEVTRERKKVRAARQDGTPLGWTAGVYDVKSLKLKMLKDTAAAFRTDCATILGGLGSVGDAEFPIGVQTVEQAVQALGMLPLTLTFSPCTVVCERESREEGNDEILVEFDLACLQCEENGLGLWSLQRSI